MAGERMDDMPIAGGSEKGEQLWSGIPPAAMDPVAPQATAPSDDPILPEPPAGLLHGEVSLHLARIEPGDPSRGFVPWYHFRILNGAGEDIGHINFRVGDTAHVRMYAGHVGFAISPEHRGRRYAGQACLALAPCIRRFFDAVIVTCDPENQASRRTLEGLGAAFLDELAVPPDVSRNPKGACVKRRYSWAP